uniref:Hydrophilic surface protein n=1 Tax=Leishmania major TaxID=5664 RepID=Q25326_LEIMA|nr:hydrophilic surface protein [Leishmania major]CAB39972.1 haspb [Leishmania major]
MGSSCTKDSAKEPQKSADKIKSTNETNQGGNASGSRKSAGGRANEYDPKDDGFTPNNEDRCPKEDGHAPKNDDHAPKEDGHAPKNDDHAPKEDGHAPKNDDHAPKEDGHAPKNDDHAPKEDGHAPKNDDHAPKEDGHAPKNDGDVQKKSEDGDNVGEGGKGNEDGNDDQPKEHAAGN